MTAATAPAMLAPDAAVYRRVAWRIIPFLFYVVVAFLFGAGALIVGVFKKPQATAAADAHFTREIPASPPDTSA